MSIQICIIRNNQGGTRSLEQVTVQEVKERNLQAAGEPKLFERPGRFDTTEKKAFRFIDADFNLGEGKMMDPIPNNAIAYVVGAASNRFYTKRGDFKPIEFTYVPVQFYMAMS